MLGGEMLRDLAKAITGVYLKYHLRSPAGIIAHRIKIEKKESRRGENRNNNDRSYNIFFSK